MTSSNAVVLCTYAYDPLDRLAAVSPAGSDSIQRFYQKSRLTTEIQSEIQRAVFQTEDHLLARQQRQGSTTDCALLGTDQQRSVLHALDATQGQAFTYSPYGFRPPHLDLPGFNGEQPDPVTGHYLLGNGYRAFNPVLMRFNSPDNLSPFGGGGLNAYAYCVGDPVNRVDPTGHTPWLIKALLRRVGLMARRQREPIVLKKMIQGELKILGGGEQVFFRRSPLPSDSTLAPKARASKPRYQLPKPAHKDTGIGPYIETGPNHAPLPIDRRDAFKNTQSWIANSPFTSMESSSLEVSSVSNIHAQTVSAASNSSLTSAKHLERSLSSVSSDPFFGPKLSGEFERVLRNIRST
ncbi:RHS repeat-associated core domain-containing protein [Pseudomonas syringae]|uniref:RHS repeat-associated core domain-containing protein n=1 Tax=Pseudomonas syringae TaxID=317 RepID=UPI0009B543B4|nr:RHS repeat-associated core domain-containing protein [Pseudomonas syringae]